MAAALLVSFVGGVWAENASDLHVLTIELPPYGGSRLKTKPQIQKEGKPADELVFLFDRKH